MVYFFFGSKKYHLEKCFHKLDANLNISDCYNPSNQILLYILWFLAFRDNQTFCNCWSNAKMGPKSELPEFNTPYLNSKTCNGLGNGMCYVTTIICRSFT